METHWTFRQINAFIDGMVRKWKREKKQIEQIRHDAVEGGSSGGRTVHRQSLFESL